MGKFWLVVAGTGRCGTKFMSEVLKSVGVNCTHQNFFGVWYIGNMMTAENMEQKIQAQLTNEWSQDADSSWLAGPFVAMAKQAGWKVVHLVRKPRLVINSLVKCQVFESEKRYGNFYHFAYKHCPAMRNEPTEKERAARFYVNWNRMIEPHADILWNVERDPRTLLDLLDIDHEGREIFDNTAYNWRGGPLVDTQLDDLNPVLRRDVTEIAERYGYEWS